MDNWIFWGMVLIGWGSFSVFLMNQHVNQRKELIKEMKERYEEEGKKEEVKEGTKDELTKKEDEKSISIPYEKEYLTEFHALTADLVFTAEEKEKEETCFQEFCQEFLETQTNDMTRLQAEIEKVAILIKEKSIPDMRKYLLGDDEEQDEEEDEKEEDEEQDLETKVVEVYDRLCEELETVKTATINEDDFRAEARETITQLHLDKLMDCFTEEETPVGSVTMRYNRHLTTFEYFSDKTVPYRFLETVGRKYVLQYHCKPIFVDAEAELVRAKTAAINNATATATATAAVKKPTLTMEERRILALKPDNNHKRKSSSALPLTIENSNRYAHRGKWSVFCAEKKAKEEATAQRLAQRPCSYAEFKKLISCK